MTARAGMPAGWFPPDSSPAPLARIPSGPLAADSAVRLAILRSPHIRAALAEVGIAAADLWQASTFPNPVLDALYAFPASGIAVSSANVGFSVVRALQVPLRRRVAAAELTSTELRIADVVLRVAVDAQRAYVTVQHAQQVVELRRTAASAAEVAATAAKALRAAGNVPALRLASEEAAAAESVVGVMDAEGELLGARAELARLMAADVPDSGWTVPARLADPDAADWTLAIIDSLALARRLDIGAARESARAAAATLGLSTSFRFLADGTIGATFEREPDGRFAGPSASVPLPLFDRGGAGVARAAAVLRQRVAMHDALVVNVHAEVRTRLAQVRNASQRARQLRTVVLPLRERVLAEAQRHVNAMDLTIFALLQAKEAEIEAGRAYLDALRDYWIGRAELERAAGGALPGGHTR
ncbi:MAG: TolC family protein [Gemmatimonadetes bacterium]|nr:TolC family protein [Gemmatimonadota bacterium]